MGTHGRLLIWTVSICGSVLNKGPGSWFPGGFGAHQFPGILIAELSGKMIVSTMASEYEGWEFSGNGLTKDREIKYIGIPIRCTVDTFGMRFKLVNWLDNRNHSTCKISTAKLEMLLEYFERAHGQHGRASEK